MGRVRVRPWREDDGTGLWVVRPYHCKKYAQFSPDWWLSNQRAFAKAMADSGEWARDYEKLSPRERNSLPLATALPG